MDLILMNRINPDDRSPSIAYCSLSCHLGRIGRELLFSDRPAHQKVGYLLAGGIVALILGFGMDISITPIIKRIATSSFVLASGGWCLLGLALFYWWIDVKNHRQHLLFFTVVGMNSLFICLFIEIVGGRWFNGYINTIAMSVFGSLSIPALLAAILSSLCIFTLEWYLCWFLYKNKIFIKI